MPSPLGCRAVSYPILAKGWSFGDFHMAFCIKIAFYFTGQRTNVSVLPTAKNVHFTYTFGSRGHDHWVDPWPQFINCETNLGQNSTCYLTCIKAVMKALQVLMYQDHLWPVLMGSERTGYSFSLVYSHGSLWGRTCWITLVYTCYDAALAFHMETVLVHFHCW